MAFTPWGQSQSQATWAPGIIDYSTAGHGGVGLSKERQAELPDWARINNWVGTHQWWEEDEDWCVPFLAFLPEIRAYAAEGARARMAVISQTTYLFTATLAQVPAGVQRYQLPVSKKLYDQLLSEETVPLTYATQDPRIFMIEGEPV